MHHSSQGCGHTAALSTLLAALLGGCAYHSINPEAAEADERAHNGYDELKSVDPGTAKLVFRARGSGHPAHFSISMQPQACQGFEPQGNVAYSGRGVVLPWIATMSERTRGAVSRAQPYRSRPVLPEPVQVRAYGTFQDGYGRSVRFGHCGPVTVRFTPSVGRAYVVEYVWGDQPATCALEVSDATDPDAPVPVAVEAIDGCLPP